METLSVDVDGVYCSASALQSLRCCIMCCFSKCVAFCLCFFCLSPCNGKCLLGFIYPIYCLLVHTEQSWSKTNQNLCIFLSIPISLFLIYLDLGRMQLKKCTLTRCTSLTHPCAANQMKRIQTINRQGTTLNTYPQHKHIS